MDLTTARVKGDEAILVAGAFGAVVIVLLVMVERRPGQAELNRRCWREKRRSMDMRLSLRVVELQLLADRAHVEKSSRFAIVS